MPCSQTLKKLQVDWKDVCAFANCSQSVQDLSRGELSKDLDNEGNNLAESQSDIEVGCSKPGSSLIRWEGKLSVIYPADSGSLG